MGSLAEELPKEIARVTEVLTHYAECGPAGEFASVLIKDDLNEASEAMMSGDVVRMIKAYNNLKDTN